jgi:hypothetical protein
MEEKLEKGAVSIVNEFNELIQGQKSIHLNGKEISAKTAIEALQDDVATARQLSGRSIRRLRPSTDPESSVYYPDLDGISDSNRIMNKFSHASNH